MAGKTRKATAPAPAPEPTPEPQQATPGASPKYTAEQLAKWSTAATDSLTSFDVLEVQDVRSLVSFTEADVEYIRRARTATEKLNGRGWLTVKLPTEIPGPVAAKILADRYAVLMAAAKSINLVCRRRDADTSNHVLKFKVNTPPKSEK